MKPTGITLFLIILFGFFAIQMDFRPELLPPKVVPLPEAPLIPYPTQVTASSGTFALTSQTTIFTDGTSNELQQIAQHLASYLRPATGFAMPIKASDTSPAPGHIYLTLAERDSLGEEGYELTITEEQVHLRGGQPAGLFWGLQTLRQLLPAAIERNGLQESDWGIPTGTIRDAPTYAYRGAMLDVARHFFSPDEVKQYIDYLARYKMNALHLHLSDDQGWRIEIKSWPQLAAYGGSGEVGGGEGGYYTQAQYTDLVAYAQERYITIIPEIDMPGHTNSALASYPELNGNGKAPERYEGIEVGFSTLSTDKEITYQFVDDVIGELAALTPGPYIHIGGDESHATPKQDYIPFVNRVQKIVQSHGKRVIGWDEIAEATLVPNAVAQYWAESGNAKKAVAQGAQLIVSPASKAYLDMQYDSTTTLGLHWAGYVPVDTAYDWDPATLVAGISREHILGVEAPLWSETVTNMSELEYMVFPRLPGIAEVGWSPTSVRDWDSYKVRLGKHQERFDAMGINYYPSPTVPWTSHATDTTLLYQSTSFTSPYGFTRGIEGPAVDREGTLYAVNYDTAGTIGVVNPVGEASLYVTLPTGSIGNGIRFDAAGTMYVADYKRHNVLRVDPESRQVSVHAHDDRMNQPNDLAIAQNGTLFASDPAWSTSTGQLWRIDTDGTTTLLEENMGTTNGVEVSPGEDQLYVNESVQRKVWVYDLSPEGAISNKRLLMEFDDFGMDGMRCDADGNLYITRHGKGTVAKVSPAGEVLREIPLTGKLPSNIAFGGPDGRTAYVTLQDRGCIETFRVEQPGRSWAIRP